MDPLSITATVISFIEVAKRIKDSVDKVKPTCVLDFDADYDQPDWAKS